MKVRLDQLMIIVLITMIFIGVAFSLFADELQVPFSCYPRRLQQDFAQYNLTLDLSEIDRTPSSWGFIVNKGSKYSIFTYKPTTQHERAVVLQVTQEHAKWQSQQ